MILEESDLVSTARQRIRRQYGEEMAAKASDQFCLAFGLERQRGFAAAEDASGEAVPSPSILEFSVPEQTAVPRAEEVDPGARARKRLAAALEEVGPPDANLALEAATLLRQSRIRSFREDFYRTAGTVRGDVERNAHRLASPRATATALAQGPARLTEICWLNRTVRTWVDPKALAEVAADPQLRRIDLPRRLEADIRRTAGVVGAPDYRERFGLTGRGIIVAVIDTEIATQHPALKDRIVSKQNFSQEPWGNPGSHGTAVAGIIAADGELVGMAPGATIYNYKVLATNRFLNGDDFGGALAIQRALEDNCHIANCSWGAGPAGDGTSREAVACDTAWSLGLTIVKSAGNRGSGTSTLTTPADADGVIVVGATGRDGVAVQDYSSRGPTLHSPGRSRPHLVAPGGGPDDGIVSCQIGGGFGDCGFGTSFAAPHVTGLLALILEKEPDLSPDEQRDLLLTACVALAAGDGNTQGRGLVSLSRLP